MFPGTDIIAETVGVIASVLTFFAGGSLLSLAVCVTLYIFQALGLYTIAMRRGIKNPWLAWLPITNMWVLGSISDQYRYVFHGQIRNRRKVLIVLSIILAVMAVVLFVSWIAVAVNLILQIPEIMTMTPQKVMGSFSASLLGVAGIGIAMWALAVVAVVFRYVCVFDLYASCSPNNKVLFLILSILFPVILPVFLFACRNQDQGMPPRKDEQPAFVSDPEDF